VDLSNTINGLERMAAEKIKEEVGDYRGKDGLLYCGKCNTKKQGRYQMPFGEVMPYILCDCAAEKKAKEEAARQLFEKVQRYRREAFPESDMQTWTFANDDGENEKISKVARNYADNFDRMRSDGKGLLFFGTVGTGKTYTAACIANALIDKGVPVLMTNFARIANTVQGLFEGKQAYYDSFNRYPLLILDDLSAERKTEYMQEIVFNVIDSRYRVGLPLIVTTNLTSDELKHPADMTNQRTYSRLLEMCLPVEVAGADRRREKLKEGFNEYRDLLGL
jgi:DNA replication protein DnaC